MELRPGLIGFPLTPFRADLSLDVPALEAAVEELARHPFRALNTPAGISEFFSLSTAEAVAAVETAVRVTAGRMPVIGCAGYSLPIAVEMARAMEAAGADALLVLPPYYANAPMDGLIAYYRAIGEATGLPLVVYSRGWAVFSPDEVARAADAVPSLRYWKDGQADARALRRIMSRLGGRLGWIGGAGDDCAAAYAATGVEVFTSSVSGISPRLALAWGEAALAGDFKRLNEILDRYVHPLFAIRARKRGYEVAVMKRAREMTGRPAGPARPPIPRLAPEDERDLAAVLETWATYLD